MYSFRLQSLNVLFWVGFPFGFVWFSLFVVLFGLFVLVLSPVLFLVGWLLFFAFVVLGSLIQKKLDVFPWPNYQYSL